MLTSPANNQFQKVNVGRRKYTIEHKAPIQDERRCNMLKQHFEDASVDAQEELEDHDENDGVDQGTRRPHATRPSTFSSWKTVLQKANEQATTGMEELRRGDLKNALTSLNEADQVLAGWGDDPFASEEERRSLAKAGAEICGNLGICHKRMGGHVASARCLQKALQLHRVAGSEIRTLVAAHLNLSSCYTEAKIPGQALKYAQAAVELAGRLIAGGDFAQSTDGSADMQASVGSSQPKADDYAVLAVAYHKVAEASEGMKDWSAASFAYTQAYEIVRRSLGPAHRLTKSFEKSTRCPRKPRPPDVPSSWPTSGVPTPRRRLPEVPHSFSGRPQAVDSGLAMEAYQMDIEKFPSWPPKNASGEEKQWYCMAKRHHQVERTRQITALTQGPGSDGPPQTSVGFRPMLSSRG